LHGGGRCSTPWALSRSLPSASESRPMVRPPLAPRRGAPRSTQRAPGRGGETRCAVWTRQGCAERAAGVRQAGRRTTGRKPATRTGRSGGTSSPPSARRPTTPATARQKMRQTPTPTEERGGQGSHGWRRRRTAGRPVAKDLGLAGGQARPGFCLRSRTRTAPDRAGRALVPSSLKGWVAGTEGGQQGRGGPRARPARVVPFFRLFGRAVDPLRSCAAGLRRTPGRDRTRAAARHRMRLSGRLPLAAAAGRGRRLQA
jgi:hypothetical protein